MELFQTGACDDCTATITIGRSMPGEPLTVHVTHEQGCEWFQRTATLGPGSTLSGDVANVMHTCGEGATR